MKIVIDINEHLYKTIKTLGLVVEDEDAIAVSEAIRNGVPLEAQPTEECEDNGSPWCLGYCPYRDTPQCPYEDTVYREETLKIIDNLSDLSYRWNVARYTINNLPSATPQKPKGHWIDTGSGQKCSECGEIQYGYDNFRFFCANCGAEMSEDCGKQNL